MKDDCTSVHFAATMPNNDIINLVMETYHWAPTDNSEKRNNE